MVAVELRDDVPNHVARHGMAGAFQQLVELIIADVPVPVQICTKEEKNKYKNVSPKNIVHPKKRTVQTTNSDNVRLTDFIKDLLHLLSFLFSDSSTHFLSCD